jgi:hypothetical protein
MVSESDLMKECCGFFELPFNKQLEFNEAALKEHLQIWAQTEPAKVICPTGFDSVDTIPITTYKNYPGLLKLKANIEQLEKTSPRLPGELMWDYYDRIGRVSAKDISGYIIGDFSFVAKTTGTVGEPKWVLHGTIYWEHFRRNALATIILSCSDSWGNTKFRIGDKGLNYTPSAPYISGWGRKVTQGIIIDIPPVEVMDNVDDTRRRFFIALEYLERGHSVDFIGGIAPSVYLMCEYLTNPEGIFKEYYNSVDLGLAKAYLFQKWMKSKLSKSSRNIKDILRLKGLIISGVDTNLYRDYLMSKLEVEPYCVYAITELGTVMFGSPEKKHELLPNLRSFYLEFMDESGNIKRIDELKKGDTYNLVATSFGGIFMRYNTDDMFRVIDIRDDGMPIFSFWGRRNVTLVINKIPWHITEALATEIMIKAGLSLSDKWAFTKILEGRDEKLLILMENTWGLTASEAERRIFEAMRNTNPELRYLIEKSSIREPQEIVKVEYLRKGAFLRYSMKKAKEGYPLGQIKPPKIIPSERQELCETLRGA